MFPTKKNIWKLWTGLGIRLSQTSPSSLSILRLLFDSLVLCIQCFTHSVMKSHASTCVVSLVAFYFSRKLIRTIWLEWGAQISTVPLKSKLSVALAAVLLGSSRRLSHWGNLGKNHQKNQEKGEFSWEHLNFVWGERPHIRRSLSVWSLRTFRLKANNRFPIEKKGDSQSP